MCSALLTGAGWEVVFVRTPLQTGLAPESLTTLVKQRMRWVSRCSIYFQTTSPLVCYLNADSMSADTFGQKADAGIEVHHRLGAYVTPLPATAHMKPAIRAVNFLNFIRDYSPILTTSAMFLLPLVLIPTTDGADVFNSIAVTYKANIKWAQRLFLAAYLARTLLGFFTYRHVGLSRLANFRSQELWTAPCKQSNIPSTLHAHSVFRSAALIQLHHSVLVTLLSYPDETITLINNHNSNQTQSFSSPPRLRLPLPHLPPLPPSPPPQTLNPLLQRRRRRHRLHNKRALQAPPRLSPLPPPQTRHPPLNPLHPLRLRPLIRPPLPLAFARWASTVPVPEPPAQTATSRLRHE